MLAPVPPRRHKQSFGREYLLTGKIRHEIIKNAFKFSLKKQKNIDILDLGCGTGSLAYFLKPYPRTLSGVDISSHMLKKAAETGLYDSLYERDIEAHLKETPNHYDMVIAAAVLIHFHKIDSIVSLVLNRLRPKGKLIFSVFEAQTEDIELNSFLMYSHSDKYIMNLTERLNCKILYQKRDIHEYHPEPIYALGYVLEKL